MTGPLWSRALVALAIAKIVAALAGVARDPGILTGDSTLLLPAWPYLLQTLLYSAAACVLWIGSREDRRARSLAIAWLLIAAAFSNRLLTDGWRDAPEPLSLMAWGLAILAIDAFIPYALWRFAADSSVFDLVIGICLRVVFCHLDFRISKRRS